ncbi:hypothetical protein GF352_04150 [archaeon]|nr:hypothetical protein [archaeon]
MTKTGTVKFFNRIRRFGFITPDDGGKDVFVHSSGLANDPNMPGRKISIKEGDKVSFEVEQGMKGKKAINVKKVSAEEEVEEAPIEKVELTPKPKPEKTIKKEKGVKKTELMKKFEKETGKNAIWQGKVTKNFKDWKKEQ